MASEISKEAEILLTCPYCEQTWVLRSEINIVGKARSGEIPRLDQRALEAAFDASDRDIREQDNVRNIIEAYFKALK